MLQDNLWQVRIHNLIRNYMITKVLFCFQHFENLSYSEFNFALVYVVKK